MDIWQFQGKNQTLRDFYVIISANAFSSYSSLHFFFSRYCSVPLPAKHQGKLLNMIYLFQIQKQQVFCIQSKIQYQSLIQCRFVNLTQIKQNFNMSDYFVQFKREHIKDYLQLILEASIQNSPEFQLGLKDHKEYLRNTQQQVLLLLEIEERYNKENNTNILFNNSIFDNGKLIAAGLSVDLHYYMKYGKGRVGQELLKQLQAIDLSTIPKNTAFVGMRYAVHKDWQNKGIAQRSLYQKSKHMANNGYILEYSLVFNPYTLKIFQRYGSTLWKDVSKIIQGQKLYRAILERDIRLMVEQYKPKL